MAESLTSAAFGAHLHSTFLIRYAPDGVVEAELTEVVEHASTPRQERFTLTLRGPREPLLPQATYRVEHPVIGALDIFLVPEAVDEVGTYYVAVFNLIRPK